MERMLNFGSLVLNGTGWSKEPISGIAEPLAFRRHFTEVADASQQRL